MPIGSVLIDPITKLSVADVQHVTRGFLVIRIDNYEARSCRENIPHIFFVDLVFHQVINHVQRQHQICLQAVRAGFTASQKPLCRVPAEELPASLQRRRSFAIAALLLSRAARRCRTGVGRRRAERAGRAERKRIGERAGRSAGQHRIRIARRRPGLAPDAMHGAQHANLVGGAGAAAREDQAGGGCSVHGAQYPRGRARGVAGPMRGCGGVAGSRVDARARGTRPLGRAPGHAALAKAASIIACVPRENSSGHG